jgi:hypothetical protein
MAIGRLYYFGLSILALGALCSSHYELWPTKGYLPHENIGNKARKDPKQEEEKKQQKELEKKREKQRKRERKERNKERKKGKPEERRRKPGSDRDRRHHYSDDDTPEWIADFSSKRKGGPRQYENTPLSTFASGPGSAPAKGTGRPGRVSFEDEQPPVVSREQNGNIANGYVPYEHIYGKGPAKTGPGRTNAGYSSPPNATTGTVARGRHSGNVRSPEGINKQHVGSPPSSTNRSKHATVQSASDTISPPPVTDGFIDPGFRAFHGM